MGVIKFNINSKIFYEDNEYIIKSYPSVDKVLLKQSINPYKEIIVKVNDLIKSEACTSPCAFSISVSMNSLLF